MSHFTVMVIGENHEKQLAPFHEFECTGNNDEYVQDEDVTEEIQARIDDKEDPESIEEALGYYGLEDKIVDDESKVEKVGDECVHKYGYAIVKDGKLIKAVNRTNPNRKWDWWQMGGRWSGFLKLKEGAEGVEVATLADGRTIVFKISDGSIRPFETLMVAALAEFGISVEDRTERVYGGSEVIGSIRACLTRG